MSTFVLESKHGWLRLNTWKEGLLSRMGHDLLLDIRRFTVQVEQVAEQHGIWNLQVHLAKDSFYVLEPTSLSIKDKEEIHQNISKHLPNDIFFQGQGERQEEHRLVVRGTISLGKARMPIQFDLNLNQRVATGRVVLSHEALQLKPYRAPLGLIRLQDRVELSLSFDLTSWLV